MDVLQQEADLIKIRATLNRMEVKLWEPPYLNEDTKAPEEESLHRLAATLNLEKYLSEERVFGGLKTLQKNALNKLAAKEKYKETGVANLRVKCAKGLHSNITNLEIELSSDGKILLDKLSQLVDVSWQNLRVICGGRVIKELGSLHQQGLRNNATIMLVRVGDNQLLNELAEQRKAMEQIKNDAARLGERSSRCNDYYLEITDQSGKVIEMPPEENKALVVAMSLHENGRASLEKKDYSMALILLSEADAEFKNCRNGILEMVDNYAILNLDIVWCYLCLQNISEISDAAVRLAACETKFNQSYGKNLERLSALKGSTGNENALLMRLHLLQGIVAFHRGQTKEAKQYLMKSKSEYATLAVDETNLLHLCNMGYSIKEARLGLRASNGDENMAVDFIIRRNEAITLARQEEEEKVRKRRLGKCNDGSWVNAGYHSILMEMGFTSRLATVALQQANNGLNHAVQLLQEQPDLVQMKADERSVKKKKLDVTDDMMASVMAVGFEPEMAKIALMKEGCVEGAVAVLAENGGIIEGIEEVDSGIEKSRLEDRDAYGRIKNGIPDSEDDHLDLDLFQENEFLQQYLQLLPINL